MSSLIDKLTESFRRFPGIGPRQARRFVYYLLAADSSTVAELVNSILKVRQAVRRCRDCQRLSEDVRGGQCDLCRSRVTDPTILMVVEKDADLENIAKAGGYAGRYFVLGGLISPLEKEPYRKPRIRELQNNLDRWLTEGLQEIVLALSANPDADYTAQYLKTSLEPILKKNNLTISTLGRGISTGTELEYSDADTIRHAIKNRS